MGLRFFEEDVATKKFFNMARQMAIKASVYNGFIKAMVYDQKDVQLCPCRSWIRMYLLSLKCLCYGVARPIDVFDVINITCFCPQIQYQMHLSLFLRFLSGIVARKI
jgi:hypothetical protein